MSARLAFPAALLPAGSMLSFALSAAAGGRRGDCYDGGPLPICSNTGWQDVASVFAIGSLVLLLMAVLVAIASVIVKLRNRGSATLAERAIGLP